MAKIMRGEDDNNLREIYEARLLAEGYQVISAKDGEEALALATKEKPDLIISDVMMPKISGFDMLDILRTTPGIENTKVVMMTALSQAEDKERADKLGADKYLVKSQVTLEDVAQVADELLNGRSTPAPAGSPQPEAPAQTENTTDPSATVETPVATPPSDASTSAQQAPGPAANEQPTATNPPAPAPEQPASAPTDGDSTPPQQANNSDATTNQSQSAVQPEPAADQSNTQQPVSSSASVQSTPPVSTPQQPSTGATDTNGSNPETPTQTPEEQPQNTPQAPNENTTDQVEQGSEQSTATNMTSAQPTPPPAPAATMPQVSIEDGTPTFSDTANQSDAPKPTEANNSQPEEQAATGEPLSPPVDGAQSSAEEGASVDAKIEDFVKNQLHSNEPAEAPNETPEEQPEKTTTEADELNQGTGFSLPSSEPTQDIAVKAAPQDNNAPQNNPVPAPVQETAPSPNPAPAPAPSQEPELAAAPKQDAAAPNAATGGQRVIQPINDTNQKPDINQLAQDEADKALPDNNLPASSVVSPNGETVTPANPNQQPNDTQPGNVIQPGGSNPAQENNDPNHPDNIAL